MISDEERLEVAARLRDNLKYMRENEKWYEYDLDTEKCGNRAYRTIAASVEESGNFVNGNYIHIVETLADLIDPTCEYVPIGEERFGCSECGYTVELDFDVPVTDETPMPFKHCPECGARVVAPNGE